MKNKIINYESKILTAILVVTCLTFGLGGSESAQGSSAISAGLVAYYPFNGNANDESGNGNHATVSGPTLVGDRFGSANSAYSFDGVDDFLLAQSSQLSGITSDVTISLWVKKTQNGTNESHLLRLSSTQSFNQGDYQGYTLEKSSFMVYQSGGGFVCYLGSNIRDGQWHHLVGICENGSMLKIYKDGTLVNTFDQGKVLNSLQYLHVGGFEGYSGNEYPKGTIDDIRIYNRALSDSEVQELYAGSITVTSPVAGDCGVVIGNTRTITWNSSECSGDVKIELGRPSACGRSWSTIASAVPASDGSYPWPVAGPAQDNCIIRVTCIGNPDSIGESGEFDIRNKPHISTITFSKSPADVGDEIELCVDTGNQNRAATIYNWEIIDPSGEVSQTSLAEECFLTPVAIPGEWSFYCTATDNDCGDQSVTRGPDYLTVNDAATSTLTIARIGDGAVVVDGQQIEEYEYPWSQQYAKGEEVSLEAWGNIFGGWTFTGWTGDLESSDPVPTISMGESMRLAANFANPDLPILCAAPETFTFTADEGDPDFKTDIFITNCGGGGTTLNWEINESADWLEMSSVSGSTLSGQTDAVGVSFTINGLSGGTYTEEIGITNSDSGKTETVPVVVVIEGASPTTTSSVSSTTSSVSSTTSSVSSTTSSVSTSSTSSSTTSVNPPGLCVDPTSLSFTTEECGNHTASGTFTVQNCGSGTLSWNAAVQSNVTGWLSISPENGVLNAWEETTVFVNVDTSCLGQFAGATGDIYVTSAYGNSTVSVNVTNIINDAPNVSSVRFGSPDDDWIGDGEGIDKREQLWVDCNASDSHTITDYEFVGYSPSGTRYEIMQPSSRWYFKDTVGQQEIETGDWDVVCRATDECGKASAWVWAENKLHVGAYYYDVTEDCGGCGTRNGEPEIGPGESITYCIANPKPRNPKNLPMTFTWVKGGAGNSGRENDMDENFCFTYTNGSSVPNYELGKHQLDVEGEDPDYTYCGEFAGMYTYCSGNPRHRYYFYVTNN